MQLPPWLWLMLCLVLLLCVTVQLVGAARRREVPMRKLLKKWIVEIVNIFSGGA
jgi:bacteriorhodopsin